MPDTSSPCPKSSKVSRDEAIRKQILAAAAEPVEIPDFDPNAEPRCFPIPGGLAIKAENPGWVLGPKFHALTFLPSDTFTSTPSLPSVNCPTREDVIAGRYFGALSYGELKAVIEGGEPPARLRAVRTGSGYVLRLPNGKQIEGEVINPAPHPNSP